MNNSTIITIWSIVGLTIVICYSVFEVSKTTRLLVKEGYHQQQQLGNQGVIWTK